MAAIRAALTFRRASTRLHTLALDGVFAEGADGELAFHPLPALTNADVADLLQIARTRIWRRLGRQGVIEDDEVTADRELAGREPALAQLVGPSVAGSPPVGPALRRQDPIQLRSHGELELRGLCAAEHGFSLHVPTTAGANDRAGKEALSQVHPPPAPRPGPREARRR